MNKFRTLYIGYLIVVLLGLLAMVWWLPQSPWISTIWIGIHLFILLYLFPKVLKIPSIQFPNQVNRQVDVTIKPDLLSSIFSLLDQYVMVINPEGKILHVSKPFVDIFLEEGRPQLTLNELRSAPKLWSAINQGLGTEKGSQGQWEISTRIFQSSITPIVIHNEFGGLLITAFDITKVSQLEQIQSDFLADISHEIKTPVAAILGASEILQQGQRKLTAKETKEFQAMIASESARLQRLIHELTDLSKMGTQGFQTLIKTKFHLIDLIKEVQQVHLLNLEAKQLALTISIPSTLSIFVDRDKFFLIFSNLLSNAIRYTEKGRIHIQAEVKNRNLIIYFSDTGQGIEPKNIDRIFDRFYRTDTARTRVQGGAGLGLAITRAIIQAHQGTIEVKSELGKGTTFTMTIPHLT